MRRVKIVRFKHHIRIKWWTCKDQTIADDYTKDVINSGEDDEEYDWTILCDTMKPVGNLHYGVTRGGMSFKKTGNLVVEPISSGSNSREKGNI